MLCQLIVLGFFLKKTNQYNIIRPCFFQSLLISVEDPCPKWISCAQQRGNTKEKTRYRNGTTKSLLLDTTKSLHGYTHNKKHSSTHN